MKKFRYRLERVLQYRQVVRAERQRELLLARQKLASMLERLSNLESELLREHTAGVEHLTAEFLELTQRYTARVAAQIEQLKEMIVECEKEVEEARLRYVEASQEAEALVKHKGHKHQEYEQMIDKVLQNQMDETTVQRFGRN